jgi:hypothetical protein
MTIQLRKKERILRTMNCQEVDRIPLYDLLYCNGAIQHFSGEELPPFVYDDKTIQELDRITGKAIANFLDMTRAWNFGPVVDRSYSNEYGFVIHESAWEKTAWIEKRPFNDLEGAKEFMKRWLTDAQANTRQINANPGAYREQFHKNFLENTSRLGDTIHLITQQGSGLDEILYWLGMEMMTYLMTDDPGFYSEALEILTCQNLAICHAVADPELSPIVLTYTDIAHKNRLTYSPRFLRQEIFPRVKRLNDAWHEYGIKCLYHSDGYLMEVLDDLVAIGIDGLNPIETVAGMSLKEVRTKYPNLFLAGGIDMSQLLSNGAPEQVKEVCRQAIQDAYPGFFMGSTTEADNSCKTENLIAMYEVAMEGI